MPRLWLSSPLATTVTAVTSVTPIVSAAAVTAVRPGLRMALRRASTPALPPRRSAGRPTTDATPRTSRAKRRTRASSASAARSAATGAIRVARRAGSAAASTVASVPTASEATIVRVETTVLVAGRSRPTAENSAFSPASMPSPAAIPAPEASRPTTSASSSTLRRTCRRDAPTIRSRPNSRVRWATVIDSELKIVNAPTSTATPAKASRIVRMMFTNVRRESNVKRSSAAALLTVARGPAAAATARRTSPRPATRMRS